MPATIRARISPPIGLIASMPVALIAHPSFPAKTVADVIAIAKKDPGKLNFGTSAIGTGGYLTAEYVQVGRRHRHADRALQGHRAADERSDRRPRAGRRSACCRRRMGNIAGRHAARDRGAPAPKRFSLLPDVPTAAESGLPGFESVLHYGLLAPAGMPRADRRPAQQGAARAWSDTDLVKQRIQAEGGDAADLDARGIRRRTSTAKRRKWSALIRKLNLKVE